MNIIKRKLSNSPRHGFNRTGLDRHGLSVIEVLTSIVVALIGVFGVLAMIPFSVKQTQSGLDQDAATSMARNALANFEASGFNIKTEVGGLSPSFQLNWLDEGLNPVRTGTQAGSVTNCGGLLCIDPLGITESDITESGDFASASFPFHNESLPDNLVLPPSLPGGPLVIPAVTLARPGGAPFSLADARRMFRLTDDLVFEQADNPDVADSDLLGPVQIFNEGVVGGAVQSLNRQSNGTISWCALVHPQGAANSRQIENLKFYMLVFKDRETTVDPDPMVTDGKMAAALVTAPTTFGQAAAVTIDDPVNPIRFVDQVRRNDWVMLINRSSGTEPEFRRTNVSFARVANTSSNEAMGTSSLTLDGPDFLFTPPTPAENATYIVHLKDVVAVFPRTIKLEDSSEWTVSTN